MGRKTRRMRAIDLYSGVGGWSLGLRLAGIDVVASYEIWGAANETNFKNNSHRTQTIDIRRLSLSELPQKIDIVVGSPPCTQFSMSNRGGGGDIDDGLQDIIKFLSIVDHLRPKMWAMENVPRVEKIIRKELRDGGALAQFRHLQVETKIVNMEDYGVPQRRRRCLIGNLNFERLEAYTRCVRKLTLGRVIKSISANPAVDPLFGIEVAASDLTEHAKENPLSAEEVRINRAAKTLHPVYNSMAFPEPLSRSVRTLTATCTRVSRESIVVKTSPKADLYRRLSIRERASLQGFPLCYQFYAASYSEKIKMVGNAIPPAFTFLVAHAFKGTPPSKLPALASQKRKLVNPVPPPVETPPHRAGAKFSQRRRFWFAIPSLRLKSGVRFELCNLDEKGKLEWRVRFYFGTSKSIHSMALDEGIFDRVASSIPDAAWRQLSPYLLELDAFLKKCDIGRMQDVWTHRGPGGTSPFCLLDAIDEAGASVARALNHASQAVAIVNREIERAFGSDLQLVVGRSKLERNASQILAGLLIGSKVNSHIANMELSDSSVHKPKVA